MSRVAERVRLTHFESLGSISPTLGHLAGWATFSDRRRIHVFGTVGTTAWQYSPTYRGQTTPPRKLSGVRVHLLNEALVPFITYERRLQEARLAAETAGQGFNLAVTNVALARKDAGERLLESCPSLVARLGQAAASAKAAHHDALSDELVSVAEALAGFSYMAVAKVDAMNDAEQAFKEARAACDAIEPPPPEIPEST